MDARIWRKTEHAVAIRLRLESDGVRAVRAICGWKPTVSVPSPLSVAKVHPRDPRLVVRFSAVYLHTGVPPMPTPFKDGEVNTAAIRGNVKKWIAAGLGGVLAC